MDTNVNTWSASELKQLKLEDGFRLRGLDTTRLETFVDAAFAFVLTLLVISFDELPSTSQEIADAVKRIPAFAASFAVLMMFWCQHRSWTRRFGLENNLTIIYSLMLIFVVLVYVYPLRMIFEGLFAQISGGYLPTSYNINTYADIRMMFVFYSIGFFAMSTLIALLYAETLKQKECLLLNDFEIKLSKVELTISLLSIVFSVASIAIALLSSDKFVVLAGYVYMLLIPFLWVPKIYGSRYSQN